MKRPDDEQLETRLQRSFVEGVTWPIDRASLAALTDMGLADDDIARLFGVTADAVRDLRLKHSKSAK